MSARRGPRRKKIMKGPVRRHPWLAVILLLVGLISIADHAGLSGRWQARRGLEPPDDPAKYHGQVFTVTNVVDGDSLDLGVAEGNSPTTRVRLWGVDTPEVAGSPRGAMYFGDQASAYTRQMVSGQRVRVELVPDQRTRDRYDRLLAYIVVEKTGVMLNEALIRSGHAYADPRFDHPLKERFLEMERSARRRRAGLWENVTPDQYPYWKQKRSGRR